MERCNLCPRNCNADRTSTTGYCKAGTGIRVARAALHFMEEPCISGKTGSGTVFFSGCNLRCVYCQNYTISHENFGKEISVERLAEIFLELQEQGAVNINLVTGVMYVPWILRALDRVKGQLRIPVVYNSGGYESTETLRMLEGYVDIYLTDIKYYQEDLAIRYSAAPGYFFHGFAAAEEMIRQRGKPEFYDNASFDDETAVLKSGVIIRHLVLPGMRQDSIALLQHLSRNLNREDYILSLMSQFTPCYRCTEYKEINRRVTSFEYDSVINKALELGLDRTYIQDRNSAGEEYTPSFCLEGC
ncbi:MAG: radical SAM protein [Lachnospiraceae bacterium]|nr:radical SAM protein [Lachnospiraceae bacterium]